jgi:hypothetical protein
MEGEFAARATRWAEAGAICGEAISTGAFCNRFSGKDTRADATARPLVNTTRGTTVASSRLAKSSLNVSKGSSPSARTPIAATS